MQRRRKWLAQKPGFVGRGELFDVIVAAGDQVVQESDDTPPQVGSFGNDELPVGERSQEDGCKEDQYDGHRFQPR